MLKAVGESIITTTARNDHFEVVIFQMNMEKLEEDYVGMAASGCEQGMCDIRTP